MRTLDEGVIPVDFDKGVSLQPERPLHGVSWQRARDAMIVVALLVIVGSLLIVECSTYLPRVFR